MTEHAFTVDAHYSKVWLPEHKWNCCVEALPPALDFDALNRMMRNAVPFSPEERDMPDLVRKQLTCRLRHLVEPVPDHYLLYCSLYTIINEGYVSRNPLSAATWQHLHWLYHKGLDGIPEPMAYRPTASATLVTGPSGTGKTTSVERVLALYPELIRHSIYRGQEVQQAQIVRIKVCCPTTIRGLIFAIFKEVERITGRKFLDAYLRRRANVDELIDKLHDILAHLFLGILVIDDIQNLKYAQQGGAEQMMGFCETLINTIGIPVLFVGTPKAERLFTDTLKGPRRLTDPDGCRISRPTIDSGAWNLVLETVWKYQWVKNPVPLDDHLRKTIYDLTQGINDFLIKLFAAAQWEAILDRSERLSVPLLQKVSKKKMDLLAPALDALRSRDPEQMDKFEDLLPAGEWFDWGAKQKADSDFEKAMAQMIRDSRETGAQEQDRENSRKLAAILAKRGMHIQDIQAILSETFKNPASETTPAVENDAEEKTEWADAHDLRTVLKNGTAQSGVILDDPLEFDRL